MKTYSTLAALAVFFAGMAFGHAQGGDDVPSAPGADAQPESSDEDMPAPTPAPATAPAPAPVSVVSAVPPTEVAEGIIQDANSGALYLSPSALMPPKGTWVFQDTELFVIGGSYSFTDNFSMSLQTLVPITGEFFPYLLTGKLAVVNKGRLRLAAQVSLIGVLSDDDSFNAANVGGAATYCLDTACHSYLNGYASMGFLLANDVDQSSLPLALSAGLVQKLTGRVKFALELNTGAVVGDYDEVADGLLAFYGVRFTSRSIGVNAGLVRPFAEDYNQDTFPLGFPWVSFSYRGLPVGY